MMTPVGGSSYLYDVFLPAVCASVVRETGNVIHVTERESLFQRCNFFSICGRVGSPC